MKSKTSPGKSSTRLPAALRLLCGVLGVVVCLATSRLRGGTVATEANRMAEISFESAAKYADPFNEITLDAVFKEPGGRARRVPAFWAGGATWRVRYASPTLGSHTFRTECSDTANSGLHGISGAVEVKAYAGANPLFQHGPVHIAQDKRHFAHADGTPFFWLGDAWWMGLTRRLHWPDEFQQLTADRRDKGFTVVQMVAGLYPDMPAFDDRGQGDAGFPWEQLYTRIRPEYFDAADQRVQHLVEQGLAPCIVGAWGYHLPWLGKEKIKQHWRYLVGRWGALPVVWCASGEQIMPWYTSGNTNAEEALLKREWTDVIRYLRNTDPFERVISTHPTRNAREQVTDPAVLDFEMQQTGHSRPAESQAARAIEAWTTPPVMPIISGEARYEALEISPIVGTREARQAFWAHLLYSGCAGHSYGANGIWQINRAGERYGLSPNGRDWGGTQWNEAMRLPGSRHIANGKRFLLTLPWSQFAPATNLAVGAISAAATSDGTCALVFTVSGWAVSVDLAKLSAPINASWFDPVSGELKPIPGSPFPNTGSHDFTPPQMNAAGDSDWVLLLRDESQKAPPATPRQ